jgi:acyl carrier protein
MNDVAEKLKEIFCEVFLLSEPFGDFINFKIGDFDEWDSLGNYAFLLRIEEDFKIRFSTEELSKLMSIRDIISYFETRKS